jgi:hypothetical protein
VSSVRASAVPRAPAPLQGVTPRRVPWPATELDVPRSSALVRAHAPSQPPPVASVGRLGPRGLAGGGAPLLGVGPSRRSLLTLSMRAGTRTPPPFSGPLARFFPDHLDLTSVYTGAARWHLPHPRHVSDGHLWRGCRHARMFRLPDGRGLPVAPPSRALVALQMLPVRRFVVSRTSRRSTLKHRPSGRQAVYTTPWTCGDPPRTVVSLQTRSEPWVCRDFHPLDYGLVGRYIRPSAAGATVARDKAAPL